MIVVQPRFRIGAPSVLCLQSDRTQQRNVCGIADAEFSLRNPGAAKPGNFTIASDFERIAGDAVGPGVANFLRNNWQLVSVGLDGIRNLRQAGGVNVRIRKAMAKFGIDPDDFIGRVGTGVVVRTSMTTARSEPGT